MIVVPMSNPVTAPEVLMEAIVISLVLQIPPGVASDNVIVVPLHKWLVPLIGVITGKTVTVVMAEQPTPDV